MSSVKNQDDFIQDTKRLRETIKFLQACLKSKDNKYHKKVNKTKKEEVDFRDMKINKKTRELVLTLVAKNEELEDKLKEKTFNEKRLIIELQEADKISLMKLRDFEVEIEKGKKVSEDLGRKLENLQQTVLQRGVKIKRLKRELLEKNEVNKTLSNEIEDLKTNFLEWGEEEDTIANLEAKFEASRKTAIQCAKDARAAEVRAKILEGKVEKLTIENKKLKSTTRERAKKNTKMQMRRSTLENILSEFGTISKRVEGVRGGEREVDESDQEQIMVAEANRDPEWTPSQNSRKRKPASTKASDSVESVPRKSARLMARAARFM